MHLLLSLRQRLLSKPDTAALTFSTWGDDTCGLETEQILDVMEWLSKSLLQAGYRGKAQIIWYVDNGEDESYQPGLQKAIKAPGPTFLYRCGEQKLPLPKGYYWRLMAEYPTQRVYQLELQD
jgi:hypothetical protein